MSKETVMVVSGTARRFLNVSDFIDNGFSVIYADKTNYTVFIDKVEYIMAGLEPYTKKILSKAKKLKMISRCAHGTNNIIPGIVPVMDCRGVLDRTMAEVTIGYMIMALRHLKQIDINCRMSKWDNKLLGRQMSGKTVGIVGYGGIGQKVAKLLKGWNVKILHNDIIKKRSNATLGRVVTESDIVTLHCDLNPSSWHLIDGNIINFVKPGAILINTSRGEVIDEKTLIKNYSKFSCIVLDVFEEEPLSIDSKLIKLDNVILGTHSAGMTSEGRELLARRCLKNILDFKK